MPDNAPDSENIDWSLTTWEGARREQLRHWSLLSLEEMIRAQEDMAEIAGRFAQMRTDEPVEKRDPSQS